MPAQNATAETANPIVESVAREDRVGRNQTIYDAGWGAIFWRNFVAGVARGLGGLVVNIFFLGAMAYVLTQWVWPQMQPLVTGYQEALKTIQGLQHVGQGTEFKLDPAALQDLLEGKR